MLYLFSILAAATVLLSVFSLDELLAMSGLSGSPAVAWGLLAGVLFCIFWFWRGKK